MDTFELARDILRANLQLGARAEQLTRESPLMGALPEFNSLSVVGLIAAIEEACGCAVADDEISADIFETAGAFCDFIASKMA